MGRKLAGSVCGLVMVLFGSAWGAADGELISAMVYRYTLTVDHLKAGETDPIDILEKISTDTYLESGEYRETDENGGVIEVVFVFTDKQQFSKWLKSGKPDEWRLLLDRNSPGGQVQYSVRLEKPREAPVETLFSDE